MEVDLTHGAPKVVTVWDPDFQVFTKEVETQLSELSKEYASAQVSYQTAPAAVSQNGRLAYTALIVATGKKSEPRMPTL